MAIYITSIYSNGDNRMKTTNTLTNVALANELLEVRTSLKALKKREAALKDYFSNLIDDDGSLKVGTAVTISKYYQTRASWDTSALTEHFGADSAKWKQTTGFYTLKIA